MKPDRSGQPGRKTPYRVKFSDLSVVPSSDCWQTVPNAADRSRRTRAAKREAA